MPTTPDTFTNFASSTLSAGIISSDTSLTLSTGDGAKFPTTGPFTAMLGVISGAHELVLCSARSGDVLTIVRAQEGTTASAWSTATAVTHVVTAANLNNLWTASTMVYNVRSYGAKGDGTTNDTTAIQAAITAAQNAGGGTVFVPFGTYIIQTPLNITVDNIQVQGCGWGSIIKAGGSWAGNDMLYVQGGGTFRYGIRIQDIFFDGNSVASLNGLNLESVYHCVLDHVRIRNISLVSVWMNGTAGKFGAYNAIRDCTITDGTTASSIGVKTTNSEWLIIEGTTFVTFTTAGAYGVVLNNLNCEIVGCGFDNCDTSIWMSFSSRSIVSACQFDRGGTRFINLRGNQGSTVTGCTFNTKSGSGTECIYVNDSNNQANSIVSNMLRPGAGWTYFINESSNVGGPGNIYSANTTGGVPIGNLKTGKASDNINFNPLSELATPPAPTVANSGTGGTVPAGTYQVEVGIVNAFGETLPSAASSTVCSGTTSKITITAPLQVGNSYGWYAYVTQAGGSTFLRQQALGSPSQFLNDLVITANPTVSGAAPPGANTTKGFTQPAVPATTVAYRNAFGVDMTVYISGGTVTVIAIGNQTTGLTSGTFRVAAYESITLTYSVAPSWQWRGD